MIRELGRYQVGAYADVMEWPLREALIAYRAMMLEAAREQYRHELTVWSAIAPHAAKKIDPPKPPPILRGIEH